MQDRWDDPLDSYPESAFVTTAVSVGACIYQWAPEYKARKEREYFEMEARSAERRAARESNPQSVPATSGALRTQFLADSTSSEDWNDDTYGRIK